MELCERREPVQNANRSELHAERRQADRHPVDGGLPDGGPTDSGEMTNHLDAFHSKTFRENRSKQTGFGRFECKGIQKFGTLS